MTLARIALSGLWARRTNTAFSVALLTVAVAAVTVLVLVSAQLEERVYRDARGIDLVVGARGSAAQLVLSSIYHLDVPADAIAWRDVEALSQHAALAQAIPLALGAEHAGFPVVGTTHDYLAHSGATLAQGRAWQTPLEAVVGADVAAATSLEVGSSFEVAHRAPGGPAAAEPRMYRVVGVASRTASVVDRLVLTDIASFWVEPGHARRHDGLVTEPPLDEGRWASALLVRAAAGAAPAELAAFVRAQGDLQAVSPMAETARFIVAMGVGVRVLWGFAALLMLCAGVSIFVALYTALAERRYDIAIMRALGASRERVMALLLIEGTMLAALGAALGLAAGHALTSMLGHAVAEAQAMSITGWTWYPYELWVAAAALAVGVLTALFPAWRAHETDIADTLALR